MHGLLNNLTPQIKALLQQHGLHARKAMGQNFLIDRAALLRIVDAAEIVPTDVVVEVGPGPGLMTRELLARAARVIAVEKDEGMARLLRSEFGQDPRLTVIEADMLQLAPSSLFPPSPDLHAAAPSSVANPYKVVANLPYYVASPILRLFLEAAAKPSRLVVLLQREVAETVAAAPGEMGLLSVAIQYYALPKVVGIIHGGSFYPRPKVDSAIVRLDVLPTPALDVAPGPFFRVVKAGFSAPRKQIVNPLAKELGMDKAAVSQALQDAGVAPQRRAETLSLSEWQRLCHRLGAR